MATGVKLGLCAVIIVGGPHRTDHGQVVGTTADVGHPIAHFDAGLAILSITDLQRVKFVSLLAVGVVDHRDAGELQFFGILHIGKRRFVDRLPAVLVQRRFGVERFGLRNPAVHKQPHHTFRLGCKVRLSIRRTPPRRLAGP